MKAALRVCSLALPLAALIPALIPSALPQRGGNSDATVQAPPDDKLPNGKSQRDEILKAEHQQNIKDAAALVDLSQQLQQDIEKNDRFVFSLSTLKKTDDIEKLVKKIRSRLRH